MVLKGTRKKRGAWCSRCWGPYLQFLTDVELGPELAAIVRAERPAKRLAASEPLADPVMDQVRRTHDASMSVGHQMGLGIAVPSRLRTGEVHREEVAVGGRGDKFVKAYHGTTLCALTFILRDGHLKSSAQDHRPAGVYVTPLFQLAKESYTEPQDFVRVVVEVLVPDPSWSPQLRLWHKSDKHNKQWLFDQSDVRISAIIFIGGDRY